jgi:predicted DNA-binding mobile mystery protein A
MTLAQLGKRLGITAPGVAKLESGESRGAISVARLSDAADALGCDLLIAFVPRVPLTEMVRNQAIAKAQHEQSRLLHTMTLEDQSAGVGQADDIDRSVERLLNTRTSRLWD